MHMAAIIFLDIRKINFHEKRAFLGLGKVPLTKQKVLKINERFVNKQLKINNINSRFEELELLKKTKMDLF